MKEIGMLFCGAMVAALRDGRKTATRRLLKPQPVEHGPDDFEWRSAKLKSIGHAAGYVHICKECMERIAAKCAAPEPPFRIYVKETFSTDFRNHYPHDPIWYRADDDRHIDIDVHDGVQSIYSPESKQWVPFKWRPSIFMRREQARLWLACTAVRVERLQDITTEGAKEEGLFFNGSSWSYLEKGRFPYSESCWSAPVACYRHLWESINGKGSWDANPFVTVFTFKVDTAPRQAQY